MSRYGKKASLSVQQILSRKLEQKKISMITCYDAMFAKIIEQTDIDVVLVGDSLGNVILGYDDTIKVTMDDMVKAASAVTRSLSRPLVCVDLPFLSYHASTEQAVMNAGRLMQEGGAHCVKLEGGLNVIAKVEAISAAGIPVMGHLGLTPQSVHMQGGYRVQGRGKEAHDALLEEALALEKAGVFAIVLEMVPAQLAAKVTQMLKVPTIGIGAGADCDGQVLVLHDMLGFDPEFSPKFLKKYDSLGARAFEAINNYSQEVKSGVFPSVDHSFS